MVWFGVVHDDCSRDTGACKEDERWPQGPRTFELVAAVIIVTGRAGRCHRVLVYSS